MTETCIFETISNVKQHRLTHEMFSDKRSDKSFCKIQKKFDILWKIYEISTM